MTSEVAARPRPKQKRIRETLLVRRATHAGIDGELPAVRAALARWENEGGSPRPAQSSKEAAVESAQVSDPGETKRVVDREVATRPAAGLARRGPTVASLQEHPVRFHVEPAPRMARGHVVVRLILLCVLGALGTSSVYWLLYLTLPAIAAMMIAQRGSLSYLADEAGRGAKALRWVAGAYAYLWLLTDAPPASSREASPVELELQPGGDPTTASALARIVSSLPAVVLLAVLSIVAAALWVVGAVSILAVERVPAFVSEFVAYKLRFQLRLFAYHLSFVEAYPSLGEVHPALSSSRA